MNLGLSLQSNVRTPKKRKRTQVTLSLRTHGHFGSGFSSEYYHFKVRTDLRISVSRNPLSSPTQNLTEVRPRDTSYTSESFRVESPWDWGPRHVPPMGSGVSGTLRLKGRGQYILPTPEGSRGKSFIIKFSSRFFTLQSPRRLPVLMDKWVHGTKIGNRQYCNGI